MNIPLAGLNVVCDTLSDNVGLSRVAELNDTAVSLALAGLVTEVLEVVVACNDASNWAISGFGWATLGSEENAHLILG